MLCGALASALALLTGQFALEPGDILIADFEAEDYGEWEVEGDAFGPGPAQGTLPGQMDVSGYEGERLVNSYFSGDGTTGRLMSPEFTIERRYISFLVGGGKYPGETCINLVIDGEAVHTATGPNDRPGGSERLDWHSWDVADLRGKAAQLEIVDSRTGGWGHINVDFIYQSEEKAVAESTRELALDCRYLNLPVKNGATTQRMEVIIDGDTVREFEIELAPDEPDFWAFLDVGAFEGKTATLRVGSLPRTSKGLESVTQGDEIRGAEDLYAEKHRPQFHFSSRRGWNNDPNGLVYYDGEYHLFYQHNPYGIPWGNMHWGHAVSPDLVHWEELPIAIYPQQLGDWCFSGSAAVDGDNTGGFRTGEEDVIVAAYTSTGRGEAIAYSNDRGRTFTDYEGNPVVEHRGRDPKIIWHAPTERWVMTLYDEFEEKGWIAFYTSPDLREWEFASRIEGYFECPEIFELPIEGEDGSRWIVYAADGAYAIGSFDGREFMTESGKHRYNFGNCFYASQTFNDIPAEDGRRIQIAWGRASGPGMPFNQMMDFPVELTLRRTAEGLRLFAWPVREIEKLYGDRRKHVDVLLADDPSRLTEGELLDIEAEIDVGDADEVGFVIRGLRIVYRPADQQLVCGDQSAPMPMVNGRIRVRMLVDRLSVEVFGNSGVVYMPMAFVPPDDDLTTTAFATGGSAAIVEMGVREINSAW